MSERPDGFGANQWLVDELWEQYKQDKNLVDPAWWDFFADYTPKEPTLKRTKRPTQISSTPAPATPATPATPQPPAVVPSEPVTVSVPALIVVAPV